MRTVLTTLSSLSSFDFSSFLSLKLSLFVSLGEIGTDCDRIPRPPKLLHGRTSGPARRSTKGQWKAEEDEILRKAVQRFKGKNWKKIAECFKDRTDVQCLHRWQKVLNPELVKGPWSKEEDEIIVELVNKYGPKKWSTIAQHLPGRIGKQCRERWHNHLNPAINKEAWTQQEELALIRAHQIYGNRWAELTKFLPGRTDNAIKNHWNSSVKKKLDSYVASGLLEQFQSSPLVGHQTLSMPSSSSRLHSSGDDNAQRGGSEAEDISECSQGSTMVGCSQSAGDLEQYYIPEMPCELGGSSNFLQQSFSHNTLPSASNDYQFDLPELPNLSALELRQESSALPTHCINANESHELVNAPFQTSIGHLDAPTSMGNIAASSEQSGQIFISDDECCRILFSEAANCEIFSSENITKDSNVADLGGEMDSSLPQSPNMQISETERSTSQSSCPPRSSILGTSCCQYFLPGPSLHSADDNKLVHVLQEQPFLKEPSKLVPVNTFPSDSVTISSCAANEKPNEHAEQQEAGGLCYEPPRFPSLDMPFLSCDLVQSGSDMQQEYSPLGIRQLMMSSMNCITPFRLWDSPSRDGSPDAVLKSAAKTFTGTPSILKKRNRDLLSPLSDRRVRFTTDQHLCCPHRPSRKRTMNPQGEDKENLDPALEGAEEFCSNTKDNVKQGTGDCDARSKVHSDASVQQSSGALCEENTNDLLFSPDQLGFKTDRAFAPSARTPRNLYRKILGTLSELASGSESPFGNPCMIFSPTICKKNHENHVIESTSVQSIPSPAPSENMPDNSGNNGGNGNFGIFGDTPFKRSIESPSAWKSPWFINSFVPGPRIDTEISIEDIGYFMSPGDRSYDAIALMKELSEHTASAYADALEVLGKDTPESILKEKRHSNDQNGDQENRSHLASNVSTECRTLDFSECGTPGKLTENGKSSSAISFSSPSAYLLKGCR
ncbi:MYB PROTEIN-RELATED [Salix viminalis]|uniref:MYB PROTEIN-RELATED n=1 Tax=Salix viminalis TaxID=40686 RepID=A0A9Q0NQL8_SALVM|nr:MYB PROTEIN-RELATED [Salix viminalis]